MPDDRSLKLVILPRTRAGLGRAGLRHHLETVHGPLVMSEPEVSGVFRSYVHHYAVDEGPAPFADRVLPDRDAVTIIRFDDIGDVAASKSSEGYRLRVGPDEDNFRELEGSVALAASETVILPDHPDAARKIFLFRAGLAPDADALRDLVGLPGIAGLTANSVEVLEGEFAFSAFDEVSLHRDAELEPIAARLASRGYTHVLATEPVTFISAGKGN